MWFLRTMGSYFRGPRNIFTDLINVLFVSGLHAVHGNVSAVQETRKKCEEAQVYGTNLKREASLW